jgi:hypothetical protein
MLSFLVKFIRHSSSSFRVWMAVLGGSWRFSYLHLNPL